MLHRSIKIRSIFWSSLWSVPCSYYSIFIDRVLFSASRINDPKNYKMKWIKLMSTCNRCLAFFIYFVVMRNSKKFWFVYVKSELFFSDITLQYGKKWTKIIKILVQGQREVGKNFLASEINKLVNGYIYNVCIQANYCSSIHLKMNKLGKTRESFIYLVSHYSNIQAKSLTDLFYRSWIL